jgi:glycerol-1-phosphate dehydrogenase [NAD(P)+]
MCAPAGRERFFHGEQVAVATLTMARIQEQMLERGPPVLRASTVGRQDLEGHFGTAVGAACWQEFSAKRLTDDSAAALTQRLAAGWNEWRESIGRAAIPSKRLASVMRRAGGPVAAQDIGLDEASYAAAVRHARFLRNRYTFLDLVDDADGWRRLIA